ncbi:uncharacterized protein LOC129743020 [Uranotaenia lowii]|uniref:uncharacterized protein LOC129743020 n=1 Tax=Uranotaenia lowii TaxID=190385 RepID=UPI00247A775D|nr:uncharacterized protein LOC129743020 [Uranotaenia lowii]
MVRNSTRCTSTPRKTKLKMKVMAKKLAREKLRLADLTAKVQRLEEENATLKSHTKLGDNDFEPCQIESDGSEVLASTSTQRVGSSYKPGESRLTSSVNQLAISSILIPECKPLASDTEIHRHTFEAWIELLNNYLDLAGIVDEPTKFTIFKVKAGSQLLQVFKNTSSSTGDPDPCLFPFSNAVHRLTLYFGSTSGVMLNRRTLASIVQGVEESDLTFINRVAATARLCNYEDREFAEIVGTVAERAVHKEVRVAAFKMMGRQGTFTQLVDKIREIEAIRINEKCFELKHRKQEPLVLAPIEVDSATQKNASTSGFRQRSTQEYMGYDRQTSGPQNKPYGNNDWRTYREGFRFTRRPYPQSAYKARGIHELNRGRFDTRRDSRFRSPADFSTNRGDYQRSVKRSKSGDYHDQQQGNQSIDNQARL